MRNFHQLPFGLTAALLMTLAGPRQGQAAPAKKAPAKSGGHAGKVLLNLTLPKALFGGTPKNVVGTNADKSEFNKPRAPLYVPPGVTNVALHKPVTSSDDRPIIGTLSLLTDGNKEYTDGSWVTLAPGKQWIQIDLQKAFNIYAIALWHYHGEARVYHDVVVQISDDATFIKGVHTVFNADQHNQLGLGAGKDRDYFETNKGKLIDAKGIKGRYVRFYSNGNTSDDENNYTEAEIYGKVDAAKTTPLKGAANHEGKVILKLKLPRPTYQ